MQNREEEQCSGLLPVAVTPSVPGDPRTSLMAHEPLIACAGSRNGDRDLMVWHTLRETRKHHLHAAKC